MHFIDNSLKDSNFTTKDILNFLYTGPEEWREPGMPNFDWRNVFNVADQLIRMFNQYGEVRKSWRSDFLSLCFCHYFPNISSAGYFGSDHHSALQTGASIFQIRSQEQADRNRVGHLAQL